MKTLLIICQLAVLLSSNLFAQNDPLTLQKWDIDSIKMVKEVSTEACNCIGSLSNSEKTPNEIAADISACIDKKTLPFIVAMKLHIAVKYPPEGDVKIFLDTNKNSPEYRKYYYQIEEWLSDSCDAMKKVIASNDKEGEFSYSKDSKAISEYNKGIDALKEDDYAAALPWFEKAVKTDPKFAFAWDNIGVCNRRLGNLDKALEAYKRSLALDPKGKTPLQNLPIVYQLKKEYDKAIIAYNKILDYYPGDPEAYFGAGRMYLLKEDMEKGLDYMCKAYNIYTDTNSPYRVDAQTLIRGIYAYMKDKGQEEVFNNILKANKISLSKIN